MPGADGTGGKGGPEQGVPDPRKPRPARYVNYVTKAAPGTIEQRGILAWDREEKANRIEWLDKTDEVHHATSTPRVLLMAEQVRVHHQEAGSG
jgi:hypothetical protein